MTYFIIIFFICILIVLISVVGWSLKNGIGPMPTSPKVKRVLLDQLPQQLQGTIYELGSGWGTLAFPLAKKYPHCAIVGYENSPVPYFVSRIRLLFSRHKNLHFKRQDFFYADMRKVSLIICYLYPGAMQKLKDKFENELKPGTPVVSNTFAVPGWKAEKVYEVQDLYHSKVYLYIKRD